MKKYLQRLALGFSTSLPVVELGVSDSSYQPDIVSIGRLDEDGAVMTDGAASASPDIVREVAEATGSEFAPSAFQARIGGAKDVWFREAVASTTDRHLNQEKRFRLTIRDSQLKLQQGGAGLFSAYHRLADAGTHNHT